MTKIVLEFKGGEPLGAVTVLPTGELQVEARSASLRALIKKELQDLVAQGPVLDRSGREETLPDGTRRFVTTARVCQPADPTYARALAQLIGLSGLQISGKRVHAHEDH